MLYRLRLDDPRLQAARGNGYWVLILPWLPEYHRKRQKFLKRFLLALV